VGEDLHVNGRPSDAASSHTLLSQGESHWWSFNLPRNLSDRRSLRDFLPSSASLQASSFYRRTDKEKGPAPSIEPRGIPQPGPTVSFTQHQANSPGWDTPWTARPNAQGPLRKRDTETSTSYFAHDSPSDDEQLTSSTSRRKRIRKFILSNPYVPIVRPIHRLARLDLGLTAPQLFRVINVAFTTAALGIAITIRRVEMANFAMGAVGSSPSVSVTNSFSPFGC
jgi:hypothetical protein